MSKIYLKTLAGQTRPKNIKKYLIDWDGKSRSMFQFDVKQFLKKYWIGHVVCEEFPVVGSRMRVDIINFTKSIAVEVNGRQHQEYNEFFHKNRDGYFQHIQRDLDKYNWLNINDIELIEIEEKDLKHLSPEYIKEMFGIAICGAV